MRKIKKIAILTSGGDAPGMNSAIYGIFKACKEHNIRPFAYIGGYNGFLDNNIVELTFDLLNGRINNGGSLIKSGRSNRFLKLSNVKKAIELYKKNQIDALIVIGGNGSITGAKELVKLGVNVVCLPATIDNDLNFNKTLGFDTATNNITNAVDNILDCLSSFDYGGVVKVMGRECSALINTVANALHTNFVVTTKDFNIQTLVKQILHSRKSANLPTLVLVREDCADVNELSKILQEKCKFQFRPHILGYIQRGGKPSAFDRMYGYNAGIMAVNSIIEGKNGIVVGMDKELVEKSFDQAIN